MQETHSSFKDKIWGDDAAVMQLTSKYKKEGKFLMSVLILTTNMRGLFY